MAEQMEAYILVQTERWGTRVAARLRAIHGVVLADDVTGPYDAMALVRTEAGAEAERILDAIRDVPGVLRAIAAPLIASERSTLDAA